MSNKNTTSNAAVATQTVRKYIYAVCPHCEHPNVHVHNGRLGEHYESANDKEKCPGSGCEAHAEHIEALSRDDAAYAVALLLAQHRTFGFSEERVKQRAAFATWSFSGIQFIAVPYDNSSDHIMDSCGNNYGSWQSVEEFRKRQRHGVIADWQALGTARLNVVCDRLI